MASRVSVAARLLPVAGVLHRKAVVCMPTSAGSLLLVDDNAEEATEVIGALQAEGYTVTQTANYFQALLLLEQSVYDAVLLRWEEESRQLLSPRNVVLAIKLGLQHHPCLVILTEPESVAAVQRMRVDAVLEVPLGLPVLIDTLRRLLVSKH